MSEQPRILAVDDDPDLVRLLELALARNGYQVKTALNGKDGLQKAIAFRPQVVICDLMMPGMDGTTLCRELKANRDLRPVYVIILTARGEADRVNHLELGADDYIVKPVALHELRARIEVGLRWIRSQTELQKMATSDSLTLLPNRYVLGEVLAREVAQAIKEDKPLSLLLLDLDHFKAINDTYGHVVGDRVLQQLAEIIRSLVRTTDIPARYGGEEFVIVLPGVDRDTAWGIARRLRQAIAADLWPAVVRSAAGTPLANELANTSQMTASLGVAALDQLPERTAEALLRAADEASYRAKDAGRNHVRLYQSQEHEAQEPEPVADDVLATRDIEVTRLYAAIARLGPAVSFHDPQTLDQLKDILGARAVGWVHWTGEAMPTQGGCSGMSSQAAERLVQHLQWTDLSQSHNLLALTLPVLPLAGLLLPPGEPPAAMATAVAALDSAGHIKGGIWAAWDLEVRLTTRLKFVLGYLARVLGLELELEETRLAQDGKGT